MQPKTNHVKALLPVYLVGLKNGKYTLSEAAESCGYSVRQMWVLKQRYLKEGEQCLIHGNTGKTPHNKTSESLKTQILALYATETYKGTNFKYFCECLNNYENIKVSLPIVRGVMDRAGLKSPEAHKTKKNKKVHRTRARRACEGDLWQIDATPFQWFIKFGDMTYYAMHGGIDDATGKVTSLYITKNECLYGYMEILRQTAIKNGLPREVYSDRSACFVVTPREKKNLTIWEQLSGVHDKKTQWQRILNDLHITQVLAWSPQAKGRIERLWSTLQGRLPSEFYRRGIKTVEEANEFLKEYVDIYNKQFAVKPAKNDNFYVKPESLEDLNDVLMVKIPRRVENNGQIKFHSYTLYAEGITKVTNRPVLVCVSEHGLFAKFDNDPKYYPLKLTDNKEQIVPEHDLPQVLIDIMYNYLYQYNKELSA